MNERLVYVLIYIAGVIVSSFAQLLLKKSSADEYKSKMREYLNIRVIMAYSLFFFATFCSLYSLKGIPLAWVGILSTTEYIFVAIISRIFLQDRPSKKKIIGMIVIIVGIIIYTL